MNVKNCRGCGRIFNYITGPFLCQACKEKMEVKFQEVKEYIRENAGVGIKEVAEACEVETSQINQWLREERLELTEGSTIFLSCESCGTQIRSGKYCEQCKYNMTMGFKNILQNKPQEANTGNKIDKDNPKMRFLK